MIEPRFEVELRGFSEQVKDPVDALMRGFGVSAARANTILKKLPAVVKRHADQKEALRYGRALTKLGGVVEVRLETTGRSCTLEELAVPESFESGLIESADPLARGRAVPRAAFRSGSHPSVSFPKTAAGVALTPASLTALKGDEAEREATSPSGGQAEVPERAEQPPSAGPPLQPGSRFGPPVPPDENLQLDEASIPAGRSGASVPAMPEVLAQIRDFEATGWEPLRPEVGLGFATPPPRPASMVTRTTGAHPENPEARPLSSMHRPATPARSSGPSVANPIVIAVVVGLLIVGAILLAIRFFGGVSAELRQALENNGRQYMPSLAMQETEGGGIDPTTSEEKAVPVRLGQCYGWIATTTDVGCDLDLYLMTGAGEPLVSDTLLDNVPIVFHCPEADGELRLRVSNAGSASCSYGLARFEGRGSVGWPLEPYLRLYLDFIAATGGGRYEPVDEIRRGSLAMGGSERFDVYIPAGTCYHVLAVVQHGSDLDMTMLIEGQEVDSDALFDNYPFVGHCAGERDVVAMVETVMFAGSGSYVRQTYQAVP